MNQFLIKITTTISIYSVFLLSFTNCFGSFPLVRKGYQLIDSINFSNQWVSKVVKSIIILVIFTWAGTISFVLDLFVFNAYEFWTDKTLFSRADFDNNGKLVRQYTSQGEKISFNYLDYGNQLDIEIEKNKFKDTITLYKNQPGKFYKNLNGKLIETTFDSIPAGSKIILKMATDNKILATKIIDQSEIESLHATLPVKF